MEGLGHDRPHVWTTLERRRDPDAEDGIIVTADTQTLRIRRLVQWRANPCRVHKPTPYPAWAPVFEPVRSTGEEVGEVHAE